MDYDVIIAGGSFAGLAVAAQLRGKRVLLIEPHPIGAVQTSACATLLAVLEATGTMGSVLQIHNSLVLHLAGYTVEYPLPYPFCTFDYHLFCRRLLGQVEAEILQASVLGCQGHTVATTKGSFEARILIDATGWRAALTTGGKQKAAPHRGKSFGLESDIPVSENGLHLYYDSPCLGTYNVGWLFPAGESSHAGFASYHGHTDLNEPLDQFLQAEFGVHCQRRYGGYFPYRRKAATTGSVFRVGDAAGQGLPLTGEGIRPALYFGALLGRLARQVIDGELEEDQALRRYRQVVDRRQAAFHALLAIQKILPGLPIPWIKGIGAGIRQPALLNGLLKLYWDAFNPLQIR